MQMPHFGESVFVCPTAPNIERAPCTRQFLAVGEWTPATVTDHIVRRILDGSILWDYKAPAPSPAKAPDKKGGAQ